MKQILVSLNSSSSIIHSKLPTHFHQHKTMPKYITYNIVRCNQNRWVLFLFLPNQTVCMKYVDSSITKTTFASIYKSSISVISKNRQSHRKLDLLYVLACDFLSLQRLYWKYTFKDTPFFLAKWSSSKSYNFTWAYPSRESILLDNAYTSLINMFIVTLLL